MADVSPTSVKTVTFKGGVDTWHEKLLVSADAWSIKQNLRNRYPGFEKRLGQIKQHTVADASLETVNIFQFAKTKTNEKHTYRQMLDGSVQESTDAPPTITTGAFGTDVLPAISGAIPASFGVFKDFGVLSDGARQHQICAGNNRPVMGFLVSTAASSTYSTTEHTDYGDIVTDDDATTAAVLNDTGSATRFYVRTEVPTQLITLTVSTPNANASVLTGKYYGGNWKAMAGFADGTASGGATLAQTGNLTWTAPADELPAALFGYYGFWYEFTLSATVGNTTAISAVSHTSNFQAIHNLSSGELVSAIEAIVTIEGTSTTPLNRTYSSDAISIGGLKTAADLNYVYFRFSDPIEGLMLAVNTPHTESAEATGEGNITFYDGGSANDYFTCTDSGLFSDFDKGMSITITGTTNNNITTTIVSISGGTIYVATGLLTAESNTSAVVTASAAANSVALNAIEAYEGTWSPMTILASTGLATAGVLTASKYYFLDRTSVTPRKTMQFGLPSESYWYRVSFTPTTVITSKTNIAIQGIQYYDISDFGKKGDCNIAWKGRMGYTFDKLPSTVFMSATGASQVLNGADFATIEAGDGRAHKILCMKRFYNELMVWQEEKGEIGGFITLFEGFDPSTYGKFTVSPNIGIMNSKCAAVIDGVLTGNISDILKTYAAETTRDVHIATIAFFLSHYGVYKTDGRSVTSISSLIQNYFDPTRAECIRSGYEDKMWLSYDRAYNVIRVGLVSGATATACNVFPVYDLVEETWSFDVLGQPLSCLTNIASASGQTDILQLGGGASDGFVYQCNKTLNDVDVAIDAQCQKEINAQGNRVQIEREVLRYKSTSGMVVRDTYTNGNPVAVDTRIMSAGTAFEYEVGDVYKIERAGHNKTMGHHISIRWRNNVAGETMYLEDAAFGITVLEVYP